MRAMQIEVVTDEKNIDNFKHLAGTKYRDDETRHKYINTRIILYDGLIVAYRAPDRSNGEAGNEEKSPTQIVDVIKMIEGKKTRTRLLWNTGASTGKLWMLESQQRNVDHHIIKSCI